MSDIPPVTARIWEDLITGRRTHHFTLFAANMCVARCQRIVAAEPHWKAAMITELHYFFQKFEHLTAEELEQLLQETPR